MIIHRPDFYDAHKARSKEFLIRLANTFGYTYEEMQERNWDMAGTRRGRPAKPTQAGQLLEALTFVEIGTNDFEDYQKFVRLSGNMAVTFNGQIAAGHPIAEELTLCPQLDKMKTALARCGKSLVISETPGNQVSVKGDKLRALVPCLSNELLPPVAPDMPYDIPCEILKEAFKVCGELASEAGEKAIYASLLLEANTCTGTNGAAILQFWHGIDLPPAMVLPKSFTAAIAKQSKPITGFGFSWSPTGIVGSVTFWFEGGAWIKTQCYSDRWPSLTDVLDRPSHPVKTFGGLFEAVEAVSHFNDQGLITFGQDKVMSHESDAVGAQYDVKGVQAGKTFNGKLMKQVAPFAETIDMTTYDDRAYFFGGEASNPIRGAIMGIRATVVETAPEYQPEAVEEPTEAEGDQSEGWGDWGDQNPQGFAG